jgi:hypothetical protein
MRLVKIRRIGLMCKRGVCSWIVMQPPRQGMKRVTGQADILILPMPACRLVIHSRTQHPVGQGGLHTGMLASPGTAGAVVSSHQNPAILGGVAFKYVYDCGSRQLQVCSRAVRDLVGADPGSKHLDLLFLSHLDSDHVNGVPDLLDPLSGARAATVVLPWVDDVERLIAWARVVGRDGHKLGFFASLVSNPVETLASFRPGRLVFLRGSEGPGGSEPLLLRPLDPEGDDGFRSTFRTDGPGGKSPPQGSRTYIGSTEVFTLEPGAEIEVTLDGGALSWLLKPYVLAADPRAVADFEHAAEDQLGWAFGSFRNRVAAPPVLEYLVRDPIASRKMAEAYRKGFRHRNLTSMALYSGLDPAGLQPRARMRLSPFAGSQKLGWLGTGDVSLSASKDGQAFLHHYASELPDIATFALPHHGALPNHSRHAIDVIRPEICYAAAEAPKNWKHPHPKVMSDASASGAMAMRVSCDPTTSLDESFALLYD